MRATLSTVLMLAALAPARAEARLSEEYTYTYEQTWRAAIRMVAVDMRFPIQERDPEIGYLLFSYRDHGRDYHGSIELVRATGAHDTPIVRVVVQVPQMPSYVERMILDRLGRKLLDDHGQPRPRRRAPPPPVDDAPRDGEEGDEPAPGDSRPPSA